MILELHLLQSFPVSNLNRDDIGQPKTATFGGVTRGRISSQSLKRAARLLFPSYGLGEDETGVRTKRLVEATTGWLAEKGHDETVARGVVVAALAELGFKVEPNGLTQYLLFVGRPAVERLGEYCVENWPRCADAAEKAAAKKATKTEASAPARPAREQRPKPTPAAVKAAKAILAADRAVDVALFGRMIADNKDFNVDAASQVAHAISSHAVNNEFDYYTAIDDFKPRAESGADMIGTVDYNTAVYYRYANLNLDQLDHNLAGDVELADRAARIWLQAFIDAVPGGKQNSMAALTAPDTLLGVVRTHGSWNLANAFLKPVDGTDLMADSTQRLTQHFQQLRGFYGEDSVRTVAAASISGYLPESMTSESVPTCDEFVDRLITASRG